MKRTTFAIATDARAPVEERCLVLTQLAARTVAGHRALVLWAAGCAQDVAHLVASDDDAARCAISTAVAWAQGCATAEDCYAAYAAVMDAAAAAIACAAADADAAHYAAVMDGAYAADAAAACAAAAYAAAACAAAAAAPVARAARDAARSAAAADRSLAERHLLGLAAALGEVGVFP